MELTVGQLSAQETTVFDCPCIGDDLNETDRAKRLVWTIDKLKRVVDQCSNPPSFRGVKTPIMELLEQDPAKNPHKQNPRDKGSAPPETKRKLNARATEKKWPGGQEWQTPSPRTPCHLMLRLMAMPSPANSNRSSLTTLPPAIASVVILRIICTMGNKVRSRKGKVLDGYPQVATKGRCRTRLCQTQDTSNVSSKA
jgi:hypothetical protein